MEKNLQPIDQTLLTVGQLFPPEKETTKFDKIIDLIKSVSSGSPWGALGQAIETTGKVCSTISGGKQRIQAVKYVADAYEVKARAEAEIARIKETADVRRTNDRLMTLYIEKSFQTELDALSKQILLESHRLDLRHSARMAEIQSRHEKAIHNMDLVAKQQLRNIDKNYAEIIRRNEMYCLLYRQYLKYLSDTKSTPGAMISSVCQRYVDIVERAIFQPSVNINALSEGLDSIMALLQFLGNPDSFFISFDQFISQKKAIEEL